MVPAEPEEVRVVVLSQGDAYHSVLAQDLKTSLHQQSSSLGKKGPKVDLTHEDFPHHGVWTVFPIIPWLFEAGKDDILWVVFCEERTRFNLEKLISTLSKYDPSQEIWLGHGLYDKEPTIRHHFRMDPKMLYPLSASGFAMSAAMIKRIHNMPKTRSTHFSIDPMYELALTINSSLISLPSAFCLENNHTECATYPLPFIPCGEPVPNEDIYFLVKTCLKFHKKRVPIIQKTWGKEALNIEFFSEAKDESIPTTPVGVPNTERGHCAKTKRILELAIKRLWKLPKLQWFVLADDDTLLSVPRLRQLLSCWSQQPVVIGERYGFDVLFARDGYNYPTGGAGMAINVAVLPTLVKELRCVHENSADDMVIGSVLTQLGIPLVHSPLFHQARPMDYAFEYLAVQRPVSFHKYWEMDPISVYEQWFSPTLPKRSTETHTEL